MLGCQDFCGYYDWTFSHVRARFGQQAVRDLWEQAIGTESQEHYFQAGLAEGLRGLYKTWTKTGEDEKCDWTFTLDESRNVLRLDMRQCPSKGFLLKNDLNADEDYCDHCMGWMAPLLTRLGIVVADHEHNHCGQCWAEMRVKGKAYESLDLPIDIRKDSRWNNGYLHRFRDNALLPMLDELSDSGDSCDAIERWFKRADRLLVLGRGPSAIEPWARQQPRQYAIVTGPTYASRDVFNGDPLAVLISTPPHDVEPIARRFLATPPEQRPLLLYTYLPGVEFFDFVSLGLPRPLPILPLLIRRGLYAHKPGQPFPTTGVFLVLLAAALGKPAAVAGIDLYSHPSGQVYANGSPSSPTRDMLSPRHSIECDQRHLRLARSTAPAPLELEPNLAQMLAEQNSPVA